jgi:sulfur-oxidizing protein SoxY
MQNQRRGVLKAAGAFGALLVAGLLRPVAAFAAGWNKEAFGAKTAADALRLIGAAGAAPSSALVIEAPEIAENGAVVPIEITSNIPGTKSISVMIEKNPFPLSSVFEFGDGAMPYVKLNVKIGESSDVRVLAEAGGKHFVASKSIKVTIGGCGG